MQHHYVADLLVCLLATGHINSRLVQKVRQLHKVNQRALECPQEVLMHYHMQPCPAFIYMSCVTQLHANCDTNRTNSVSQAHNNLWICTLLPVCTKLTKAAPMSN